MKKFMKSIIGLALTLIMVISLITITTPETANAAAAKLNKTKLTLDAGDTFELEIIGAPKSAVWSTSDKKVATVSSKGKVSAIAEGSAVITAKVGKKKLTCKVTVRGETVKVTYQAFIQSGSTLEDYMKQLKAKDKNILEIEKYNDNYYTVTLYKSEYEKTLNLLSGSMADTMNQFIANDYYNGAFTSITYDTLLKDVVIYADASVYDESVVDNLAMSIASYSNCYQALKLVKPEDRVCHVTILDKETNDVLYETN